MNGYVSMRAGYWLLFGLIAFTAHAQPNSRLTGIVTDARSQAPLEGATVVLAGTLFGAVTGVDGRFSFGPLSAGSYAILTTAPGYSDLRQNVRLEADSTVYMHLTLSVIPVPVPEYSLLVHVPELVRAPGQSLPVLFGHLPGVLPGRVDGLDFTQSVRGLRPQSTALYVDGVRYLDASGESMLASSALLLAQSAGTLLMSGGPYGLFWGPFGRGGWYIRRSDEVQPSVELMYDSRTMGLRTSVLIDKYFEGGYGELSGVYHRASNYTDGSGNLQVAHVEAGRLQARGQLKLGRGHFLRGRGALGLRRNWTTGHWDTHEQGARYFFARDQGIVRGVDFNVSRQQWAGNTDALQEGARLVVRLQLGSAWMLSTGADYYRLPEQRSSEGGVFARLARGGRKLNFVITGRADQARRGSRYSYGWGLQASAIWQVTRTLGILTGFGRADTFSLLHSDALWQIDAGVHLDQSAIRTQIRTYTRWYGSDRTHGLDLHMVASVLGEYGTITATAALTDDDYLPPAWGRLHITLTAPARLLQLGASLTGMSGSSDWLSTDMWMQAQLPRGIVVRFGVANLFDQAYTWPLQVGTMMLAEPGRSFNLALRYSR